MRSQFTMQLIWALSALLNVDPIDTCIAYQDAKADKLIAKYDLADLDPKSVAKILYSSNLLASFLDYRLVVLPVEE